MTSRPDGLSTAEAATRLGVSEKTIRRWIKAGKLRAYQLAVPQGYEWRIVLDDRPTVVVDTVSVRADTALVQRDRRVDSDRLRVVVAELQRTRARVAQLEAARVVGPPVVLPREVIECAEGDTARLGGFWARVRAWWGWGDERA